MRDVKLVRLSDDGTHVVLTHEGTGEEFALRIDDRLRGFVTSDRARVAQLPVERPSRLSPKEIQARLRAGESSEDIAAAADVTLERVMRYAGPVLAEREYVAEQAQSALLRRAPGSAQNGAQGRALGGAVTDRLEALGTNTGQIRWDAWRMPDGRWAVAVFYHLPGTTEEAQATFGFDPVGRTVVPIDDAGEWILGERTTPQQTTMVEGPAPRTPRDARPRLTAVPPPPGEEPAEYAEPAARQQDSVVRTLRPSPSPSPPTPGADGEPGHQPAARSTGEGPADDQIAYEPTVDLSRSMHDQPQPAPGPAARQPSAPTSPAGSSGDTNRTAEPPAPASQQSDQPEPPRLSPADLPDLGESTRPVAPPPEREPTPPAAATRPEAPTPEPTPEPAAPSTAATPPVAAQPAAEAGADQRHATADAQRTSDASTPLQPSSYHSPEPPPVAAGEPSTAAGADTDQSAEQQSAGQESAKSSEPAEPEPAVATAEQDSTAQPAAAHNGEAPQRSEQDVAADQETARAESNGAAESNDEETAGTATAGKKSVGQDRRTSGNRRRRAAGSRRKGAVPSWDDILFGGGGRKD